MSAPRLTVVVPTRNRAELAGAAVRSALESSPDSVTVLVSDNSTDRYERERLAASCRELASERIRYVTTPSSLPMADHWEWARAKATHETDPSHLTYLTDRMVLVPGGLAELLAVVKPHPNEVVAYNHDTVDDWRRPVGLVQAQWSGELLALDAAAVLALSARGDHQHYIPRMLNSIVPTSRLDDIAQRFGSVFDSVAPDLCFAYRFLALADGFLYVDRSFLVQYALGRSHGASYSRGLESPDSADFSSMVGGNRHFAAPDPAFQTTGNAIMHEYCLVRAELGSSKLPPVQKRGYLGAIARDVQLIQQPELRERMHARLRARGWRGRLRAGYLAQRAGAVVRFGVRHPRAILDSLRRQLLERPPGTPADALLPRLGIDPRIRASLLFDDAQQAIAHAILHPRPRRAKPWHLQTLSGIHGGMRELEWPNGSGPQDPASEPAPHPPGERPVVAELLPTRDEPR